MKYGFNVVRKSIYKEYCEVLVEADTIEEAQEKIEEETFERFLIKDRKKTDTELLEVTLYGDDNEAA